MPRDGWVCFHCGERFTTPGGAMVRFGRRPGSTAGCLIKIEEERGLLMEVRRLEAEVRELIDNTCWVCGQALLSKRAPANRKWPAHRIRGWGDGISQTPLANETVKGKRLRRTASLGSQENHKQTGGATVEASGGLAPATGKPWGLSRDHRNRPSNRFAWP